MQCLTRHWEKVQSEDLDGIEEIPDHRSWVDCCLPWSWCIWPSSSQWSLHQVLACIIINNVIIVIIIPIIMILLIPLIIITSWLGGERCSSDCWETRSKILMPSPNSTSSSILIKLGLCQNPDNSKLCFRSFPYFSDEHLCCFFFLKKMDRTLNISYELCRQRDITVDKIRCDPFYPSSTLVLKKG